METLKSLGARLREDYISAGASVKSIDSIHKLNRGLDVEQLLKSYGL